MAIRLRSDPMHSSRPSPPRGRIVWPSRDGVHPEPRTQSWALARNGGVTSMAPAYSMPLACPFPGTGLFPRSGYAAPSICPNCGQPSEPAVASGEQRGLGLVACPGLADGVAEVVADGARREVQAGRDVGDRGSVLGRREDVPLA